MTEQQPDHKALEDHWSRLLLPADVTLSGSPVRTGPEPKSYLAVDRAGSRHLLIPTKPDSSVGPRRPARGLDVQVRDLAIADAPARTWIDLQCTDAAGHVAFCALSNDVLAAIADTAEDTDETVRRVLSRWRWFWTADSSKLIEGGALGLLGELWFLTRWLGPPVTVALLQRWYGPTRTRHDFISSTASIEVKTTASRPPGGPSHHIASLEQLEDPSTGQLYLFSLQLSPDHLATTSLATLVDELLTYLDGNPEALDLATERLAAAGWTPAHRDQHQRTYRVLAEELYEVSADFPRLTRSDFPNGLPQGVDNVSYTLALAACHPWRRATTASDPDLPAAITALGAKSPPG